MLDKNMSILILTEGVHKWEPVCRWRCKSQSLRGGDEKKERVYLLVIIVMFNMGINWQQMCNKSWKAQYIVIVIVTLTEISTGLIFTLYIQDLIPQGWIIHIHLIVRVKVLLYVLLLFLNVYFIPDRESYE